MPEITTASQRRAVFLSHANPEDNEFVRWLGAKLACEGYEVWSDLTKLFGGSYIWKDVDEGIRQHAVKVVTVVSRRSIHKPGVLREASLALDEEKASGLRRFIIPARIDDLPYGEFPLGLGDKLTIDFVGNWARGLDDLLSALRKDAVAQAHTISADRVSSWCDQHFRPRRPTASRAEILSSNWVPIRKLPKILRFFDSAVPKSVVDSLIGTADVPSFRYFDLIGTFAGQDAFVVPTGGPVPMRLKVAPDTRAYLRGRPKEFPNLERKDARNHLAGLIRQIWERCLAGRGLLRHTMANDRVCLFVPKALINDENTVTFRDHLGRQRRKNLSGFSEKRSLYWHYGVTAKAFLGDPERIILTAHVIFSQDGRTPLADNARAHRSRRSFCRSWYNQQWRDLLFALLAWLAAGRGSIQIPVAEDQDLILAGRPYEFIAPVSIVEGDNPDDVVDDEDEFDPGDEDLDDDDDRDPDDGDINCL